MLSNALVIFRALSGVWGPLPSRAAVGIYLSSRLVRTLAESGAPAALLFLLHLSCGAIAMGGLKDFQTRGISILLKTAEGDAGGLAGLRINSASPPAMRKWGDVADRQHAPIPVFGVWRGGISRKSISLRLGRNRSAMSTAAPPSSGKRRRRSLRVSADAEEAIGRVKCAPLCACGLAIRPVDIQRAPNARIWNFRPSVSTIYIEVSNRQLF